jgi:hypothetical protein
MWGREEIIQKVYGIDRCPHIIVNKEKYGFCVYANKYTPVKYNKMAY